MNIEIGGITANYRIQGEGEWLLLLHGWGADVRTFDRIFKDFSENHKVVAPDLPGFGLSGDPTGEWGVGDYAEWVVKFMDALGIDRATVLGHSFGGRISIKLASAPETAGRITKLVLTGSAGLRRRKSLFRRMRSAVLHFLARLLPKLRDRYGRNFASRDYLAASPLLRKCLIKVVREDLAPLLLKIGQPTLLIWGSEDTETPVGDGHTMRAAIPNSRLEVLQGAGHFAFLNRPEEFSGLLKEFLR